ncbi:MAG: GlsB/YeaQ/YmgE family stress response membrane protein [Acidimicrobiia bacterium]
MGSVIGTIFSGLVAGVIIGPLARLVLPGKQNISLVMTVVLGAIGAIGGGLIYHAIGGGETSGIDWIKLLIEVAVAAILVVVYGNIQSSKA